MRPPAKATTGVTGAIASGYSSVVGLVNGVQRTTKSAVRGDAKRPRTCERCTQQATVYCVDCKASMCKFCACMVHHPTTKLEKHSIEEIKQSVDGIKILSPILLDVLIVLLLVMMTYEGAGIEWRVDNQCPCVSRVRRHAAYFDMNLFYWFKQHFAVACNTEDSFWRLLIDTWVRGFVLGMDSFLLIISTFSGAIIFEEAARIILAPVLGSIYACLEVAVRAAECNITWGPLVDNRDRIESLVANSSIAQLFSPEGKPPPLTFPRRRPYTDQYEQLMYHWGRKIRSFEHYRGHAQAVVTYMLRSTVLFSLMIRIFCMVVPVADCFRAVLGTFGMQSVLDRHAINFQSATGIYQFNSVYTDWVFMTVSGALVRLVPGMGGYGEAAITDVFSVSLALARIRWVTVLVVFYLIYRFARWFVKRYLAEQRKAFDEKWKGEFGICYDIWGVAPPAKPAHVAAWRQEHGGCGRVDWASRTFRADSANDGFTKMSVGSVYACPTSSM